MTLVLYRLLMAALSMPLLGKLLWRGRHEPLYRQHLGERWGWYPGSSSHPALDPQTPPAGPVIWVHAVSLGETHACAPLIEGLRQRYPQMRLVLTHGTATGRQAGADLLQPGDLQRWLPWDSMGAVKRFLTQHRPQLGLLMETEVWPELAAQCHAHAIPLVLVNARLSERSLQRTLKWARRLMTKTYQHLALAIPQTVGDANRLQQMGARVTGPVGNLKFDLEVNEAGQRLGWRWRTATARPVVMLASSRDGEEALLLQALRNHPKRSLAQWLIVPRHPQRFEEVAQLVTAQGWTLSRRSLWPDPLGPDGLPDADVWLGDSMGEMAAYYSLASCALMGGSFLPFGGQNLIEACQYQCAVIIGPHTYNFAQASSQAIESQAALRVTTLDDAINAALSLTGRPANLEDMRSAAEQFSRLHRGATTRTLDALAGLLS